MLSGEILCRTEIRIHILVAVVCHQCNVLRVVLIQRHTYLEISVERAVEDIRAPRLVLCLQCQRIRIIAVLVIQHLVSSLVSEHLSSLACILDSPYTESHLHSVVSLIEPTVGKVELKHIRLIEEGVIVHIVGNDVA